jgi:hypothetical protein
MADINCKKDDHKILTHTVSLVDLSSGYETLCASVLVLVRLCKSFFVSKYASDIKVKKVHYIMRYLFLSMFCNPHTFQQHVFRRSEYQPMNTNYSLYQSSHCFWQESEILCQFTFGIIKKMQSSHCFWQETEILCQYMFGIPNSCSYWCPFCLLSHLE